MAEGEYPEQPWSRLFSIGIDAYYNGDLDLGRQTCEQLLSQPDIPDNVRTQTLRNLSFYARPLTALAPNATFDALPRLAQHGWSWFNPSIAAGDDGITLIVRSSNFTLEPGLRLAIYDKDGIVRTRNYFVHLDDHLNLRDLSVLVDRTTHDGLSAFPVAGYEDCRLIRFDGAWRAIAATRNRNPEGVWQQALLRLDDNALVDLQMLSGPSAGHQKNWMPFVRDGKLNVVRHFHPLTIQQVDVHGGAVTSASSGETSPIAESFRGGSQGVPVDDGTLFVIHESIDFSREERIYLHRLVKVDASYQLTHVSPQFFFIERGIEYCSGMARCGDALLLSFGYNDQEAWIARVPLAEALALLRPVEEYSTTTPIGEPPETSEADGALSAARRNAIDDTVRSGIVSITLAGHDRENVVGGGIASVLDHVDICLVIDTDGATDVLDAARSAAGDKYQQRQFAWCNDFAAARNAALRFAAETGAAWAIMLDTDERLSLNGVDLREFLAQTTSDVVTIDYADGSFGRPFIFRLPARGEYVGEVHEYFQMASGQQGTIEDVTWHEGPKNMDNLNEKFEGYLDILRSLVARHPRDPRWFYYLGDTLRTVGDYPAAIEAFARCASLGGWREEGAWACYRQAECWLALGNPREAIQSCASGLARHAGVPELAWLAAYSCWVAQEFEQAIYWAHLACTHGYASDTGAPINRTGFRNPMAQYEGPYDVLRFAYRALGNDDAADEAERQFEVAKARRIGPSPDSQR